MYYPKNGTPEMGMPRPDRCQRSRRVKKSTDTWVAPGTSSPRVELGFSWKIYGIHGGQKGDPGSTPKDLAHVAYSCPDGDGGEGFSLLGSMPLPVIALLGTDKPSETR